VLRFTLVRTASALPLIVGVIIIVFCALQFVPGDPVQAMVGDFPVPPEFRATIVARYHLGDPLWLRLLLYGDVLLHGNLGYSFQLQQPVATLLAERAPRTLLLAFGGYAVGITIGITTGLLMATSRNRALRSGLTVLVLLAYAMPSFWLGQLLVIVFAMHLGWLPTQGMAPIFSMAAGWDWLLERLRYLVLPVTVYAIYEGTRVARLINASATETLGQGYIITARQKGLSRGEIVRGHIVRNSILPVITAMGYSFGTAMGGAVLIETVFSWPGVGSLMVEAIRMRDNQVIVGVTLFVAISVILMNVLVDVLYAWVDPRIRLAHT
jgi:peptide/nickel transport system permease protein